MFLQKKTCKNWHYLLQGRRPRRIGNCEGRGYLDFRVTTSIHQENVCPARRKDEAGCVWIVAYQGERVSYQGGRGRLSYFRVVYYLS